MTSLGHFIYSASRRRARTGGVMIELLPTLRRIAVSIAAELITDLRDH